MEKLGAETNALNWFEIPVTDVINNIFYDKTINGVRQNPYQEFKTFAMAPGFKAI